MINVINHTINIDLAKRISLNQSIIIKKNDTNSHKFTINILNNSVPYILTGSTARIYFKKADGTKVFADCAIENAEIGKVSCILTTQVLSFVGLVASEITIYGTESELLTSISFNFLVQDILRDDVAIESTSEFTALTEAIVKLDAWDADFQTKYDGLNAEYATELVSQAAQLANKMTQGQAKGTDFDTSTDANKLKLINMASEVMNSIQGNYGNILYDRSNNSMVQGSDATGFLILDPTSKMNFVTNTKLSVVDLPKLTIFSNRLDTETLRYWVWGYDANNVKMTGSGGWLIYKKGEFINYNSAWVKINITVLRQTNIEFADTDSIKIINGTAMQQAIGNGSLVNEYYGTESVSRNKLSISLQNLIPLSSKSYKWENGQILPTGGDSTDVNYTDNRLRSKIDDMIYLEVGTPIYSESPYQFLLYLHDADGNFISYTTSWLNDKVVETTGYYRIAIRINTNINILTEIEKKTAIESIFFKTRLTIENVVSINQIDEDFNSNLLLSRKTTVSDTDNYTCGSAPHMVIDKTRGIAYVTYLASRIAHGEARDIVALSVFPIKQPHKSKDYIVCETGIAMNTTTLYNPFEPNIVEMSDRVRVFFVPSDFTNCINSPYYYRDFIKATKVFEDATIVQFKETDLGALKPLTKVNIGDFLVANGYTMDTTNSHPVSFTTHLETYGGIVYGAVTSASQNPIIFSSDDSCATILLKGIISTKTNYETQLTFLNGVMYILNRNSTPNYFISNDLGVTFTTGTTLTQSITRPQVLSYKDKVMVAHSTVATDTTGFKITNGRQNIVFKIGTGEDINTYVTKLSISSKYGIVYYSVCNYKDDIYIAFSNSELFNDINNQGKDAIHFMKIGEFDVTNPYIQEI